MTFNKNGSKRKNAWSDEEIALLGKFTDQEVANKTGKSKIAVSIRRIKLGIDPFRKDLSSRFSKIKEIEKDLGKIPDAFLAKKIGVTVRAIAQARKLRKIKSYRDSYVNSWESFKDLSQSDFFLALKNMLHGNLTYKKLAELTYTSHSRCQKWFTPGSAQEPLSMQLKRHMYLECLLLVTNDKNND